MGILALVLVSRIVDDPPWIKHDKQNFFRGDYVGIGLLTLAMAGLQIALDKGEENDWFASNFIRGFAAMFVIGMIALIIWELRGNQEPNHAAAAVQIQKTSRSVASSCCWWAAF